MTNIVEVEVAVENNRNIIKITLDDKCSIVDLGKSISSAFTNLMEGGRLKFASSDKPAVVKREKDPIDKIEDKVIGRIDTPMSVLIKEDIEFSKLGCYLFGPNIGNEFYLISPFYIQGDLLQLKEIRDIIKKSPQEFFKSIPILTKE